MKRGDKAPSGQRSLASRIELHEGAECHLSLFRGLSVNQFSTFRTDPDPLRRYDQNRGDGTLERRVEAHDGSVARLDAEEALLRGDPKVAVGPALNLVDRTLVEAGLPQGRREEHSLP